MKIGVDTGGTFTDFAVLDNRGRLETFKLPSNPSDPASVILEGIRRVARTARGNTTVVHGSTVATNALLERKGSRTAFVSTAGFEDLLAIGRQNRARLYDLCPPPRRPLVPPELCFGFPERIFADGTVELAPSAGDIEDLARQLKNAGVESVAICFLHSYAHPRHEQELAAALAAEFDVSASASIAPEFREYERASTAAINAYVAPLMKRYLGRLDAASPYPVWVMQSNGGALTAAEAGSSAVRTILSGPAGGVVGAIEMARRAGFRRVIGFDMGGTSTDVSLCDGGASETAEAGVDGFPVRIPMLDVHTVGAGGGSIARIDEGGLLRVGPESAGAQPGPACYGTGERPTVTDAHVALGHLDHLLGGAMPLDRKRAERALRTLDMTARRAAEGVIRVANANMERAIRAVSVERGHDPREFALLAFGGCGGLHACSLAESLGMRTVLVPLHAGVLSALGMVLADRLRDYARGVPNQDWRAALDDLEATARRENPEARIERHADLRYRGQSYEISTPIPAGADLVLAARRFEQLHRQRFGHTMPAEVEVVTVRVRARVPSRKPRLLAGGHDRPESGRGPMVIHDYGSTVVVKAGWKFRKDEAGTLIFTRAR